MVAKRRDSGEVHDLQSHAFHAYVVQGYGCCCHGNYRAHVVMGITEPICASQTLQRRCLVDVHATHSCT